MASKKNAMTAGRGARAIDLCELPLDTGTMLTGRDALLLGTGVIADSVGVLFDFDRMHYG